MSKPSALRLLWSTLGHEWRLLLTGLTLLIINRVSSLTLPISTRYLIDQVVLRHNTRGLPLLVGGLIGAAALQASSAVASLRIFKRAEQRLIMELRSQTQAHVAKLPISFFRHHRTGELASRILSDIEGVRLVLGQAMLDFVGGILTASFSFIVLFHLSPYLTAFVASAFVCFVVALAKLILRVHPEYRHRNRAIGWMTGRLGETLGGVATVKGFAAEEQEAQVFRAGVDRVRSFSYNIVSLEAWMSCLSIVTGAGIGIWVIAAGVHMVLIGTLTLGSYLAYTALLAYMIAPIAMAVTLGTQLTEAFVGLGRTSELHAEQREEDDPRRNKRISMAEAVIRFSHVTFGYGTANEVLKDVSFTAWPGQVLALVGPSGAGKTTIANLVCGFDSPLQGRITINEVDLTEIRLKEYRQHLGVVFQDSFLFEGTLFENVAFACPRSPKESVLSACKAAGVTEFAESLPNGYETTVGERGVRLSGGQRQRVAIARALLADPKILILDEATASLDSEAESSVQEALSLLMKGRTTIVIAHRLSTIIEADQILVLEHGLIVERGSHSELFKAAGRYRELWQWQDQRNPSC